MPFALAAERPICARARVHKSAHHARVCIWPRRAIRAFDWLLCACIAHARADASGRAFIALDQICVCVFALAAPGLQTHTEAESLRRRARRSKSCARACAARGHARIDTRRCESHHALLSSRAHKHSAAYLEHSSHPRGRHGKCRPLPIIFVRPIFGSEVSARRRISLLFDLCARVRASRKRNL